jgi:hypothetical protein
MIPSTQRQLTFAATLIIAVAMAVALPAQAAEHTQKTKPVTLDPGLIVVHKNPPIKFVPFQPLDSKGNVIPASTPITLPNGHVLTTGEYYDEVNAVEQKLNALGYTLRTSQRTFTIQTINSKFVSNLGAQASHILSMHLHGRGGGDQPLTFAELQRLQRTAYRPPPSAARMAAIGGIPNRLIAANNSLPSSKTVTFSQSKTWNAGNKGLFEVHANEQVALSANTTKANVTGSADIGGYVLNALGDLASTQANFTADASSGCSGNLSVSLLGITAWSFSAPSCKSTVYSNDWSSSDDWSASTVFAVGPVPVSVTIGASGSVGFDYTVGLSLGAQSAPIATASLTPFVKVDVYAMAGVDLGIAGAGAIQMLHYKVDLTASASVEQNPAPPPYDWGVQEQLVGNDTLSALQGSFGLYAYVYGPCWKYWPWQVCKYQYDLPVWSGGGVSDSGHLFNYKTWADLDVTYPTPTPRPTRQPTAQPVPTAAAGR